MAAAEKKSNLRIAYITGAFPHVSETFIVNQIVGVAAAGHSVYVYTTCDGVTEHVPAEVQRYGLLRRTYRLSAPGKRVAAIARTAALMLAVGWRAPAVPWRVLRLWRRHGAAGTLRLLYAAYTLIRLRHRRFDVIHAQFGPYGVLAAQLVELGVWSGAIVTSIRGYDASGSTAVLAARYRHVFQHGALFLPVSATLAERLIGAGGDPAKIRVHHSGIHCRQLRYTPRQALPEVPVRLITIARLVEKKGVRYAVQAVAQVLASGRRVSYTIVGDGPLRDALEQLVGDLGISAHVHVVGWKRHDEALRLIETSDILLAPSVTAADGDEEGIPNAVKEAMALGLPVVSTTHGGIPELVEDGVSGFLVAERDADAIADRLSHLVDRPEVWAEMGAAGRRRVEAEFDSDQLNAKLIRLYRDAATKPATAPLLAPVLSEP